MKDQIHLAVTILLGVCVVGVGFYLAHKGDTRTPYSTVYNRSIKNAPVQEDLVDFSIPAVNLVESGTVTLDRCKGTGEPFQNMDEFSFEIDPPVGSNLVLDTLTLELVIATSIEGTSPITTTIKVRIPRD